jgi:zinc/manganese transport system substrate-binding protein
MLNAANNPQVTVINVADVSGYDQNPASGDFNEHLWYDFPTVIRVSERMAAVFSKAEPSASATFGSNERAFVAKIAVLQKTEANLKSRYAGTGVAITEPVPLYMLEAIGLDNKTPEKFSEAIENSTDVAPGILEQTLALFNDHAVRLLAYNEQTTGAQTEAVLQAARKNKIAVVPVTETLPAGKDYLSWMTSNLSAIEHALAQ